MKKIGYKNFKMNGGFKMINDWTKSFIDDASKEIDIFKMSMLLFVRRHYF